MRSSIRVIPAFASMTLLATLLSTEGCGLVTNTTAIQCTSQQECVDKLGFADTTCDRETKLCVKVSTAPECSTNAECIAKNGAFNVCRKSDKKCISLTSNECPSVMGPPELLQNDDTIILGAITPVGSGELGDVVEKGAQLAQREITPSSTGTGVLANGQRTPLVIVSCHEFNSDGYTGLLRAANHLVKNVQVPLMIGPIDVTDAELVATNVSLPAQILSIYSSAIVSNIDSLSRTSSPLIWRLNYSDTHAANVVQPFINKVLIPKMRADGMVGADEAVRIAIVQEGDYKGRQVAQVITQKLTWNVNAQGQPANCSDNINYNPTNPGVAACIPADFGSLLDTVGNPAPEGKISLALGAVLVNNGAAGFPPHIVLHSYATFGIQRILFAMEGAWESVHGPTSISDPEFRHRPYHIGLFAPWNTFEPMFGFMDTTGVSNPNADPKFVPLRERVFALYAHETGDPTEIATRKTQYEIRYKTTFPEFAQSASPSDVLTRQTYDAVYLAAYAITALNGKPITGQNLAATLPRLLQGERVVVGPDDLQKGLTALSDPNKGINLDGLSGSLDLNPNTGSVRYDMEISCPGVVQSTGASTNFVASGYYYDEASQVVQGQAFQAPTGTGNGGMCPRLKGKW